MAVKDASLYHATQGLILATPRKYYHDDISTRHWQLRSLISSPEQSIVYYPHKNEIISLNTKTRCREVISKLDFEPRCLTASTDWLLCGSEFGKYAAIPLMGGSAGSGNTRYFDIDIDSRLPLEFDPVRRSWNPTSAPTSRSSTITPISSTIGSQIVNCITIWNPGDERSKYSYQVPVAVVATNDSSVSILDLKSSTVLDNFVLPDLVNRSVMSPDGSILASVCDDPFLYIHQRKPKSEGETSEAISDLEWVQVERIHLHGQKIADGNDLKGSFAACFSKSGIYLAVATQYGVISIFETATLIGTACPPIVFTTSRPGPEPGAVRAMEFSGGPYDLLAWTESHGRFCVADVRNSFLSRQLVMLDRHADNVEKVEVVDRKLVSDPIVAESSLRVPPSDSRTDNNTPDHPSIEAERRQVRQMQRVIAETYPSPFTAEETEVLQASQVARRHRDSVAGRNIPAEGSASLRWSSWDDFPRLTASSASRSDDPALPEERLISTAGLPPALRQFVTSDLGSSISSFIGERNRENTRRILRQQEPRRRNSAMLAALETTLEREVARNEEVSTNLERLTLIQPRINPTNPWTETESRRLRYSTDAPLDRTTRLRVEVEGDARGDFADRLRQHWRPSAADEVPSVASRTIPSAGRETQPGETMGCCWSPDGRILYVGAGEGIYEYHVNIEGRKRFPSIVMR